MRIYVGLWSLLPKEWEGYNGLVEKTEEEINAELSREIALPEGYYDNILAIYTRKEFEETLNQDLNHEFRTDKYWVRFFL